MRQYQVHIAENKAELLGLAGKFVKYRPIGWGLGSIDCLVFNCNDKLIELIYQIEEEYSRKFNDKPSEEIKSETLDLEKVVFSFSGVKTKSKERDKFYSSSDGEEYVSRKKALEENGFWVEVEK